MGSDSWISGRYAGLRIVSEKILIRAQGSLFRPAEKLAQYNVGLNNSPSGASHNHSFKLPDAVNGTMTRTSKKILLINPWIYDFAAYDLWAKPLGLLWIGGCLRAAGYQVDLVDCLDVDSPWMGEEKTRPSRKPFHCGKFFKEPVEKPLPLRSIPRTYSRYGITEAAFWRGLCAIERPDLVLVTSLMTYWYPGPFRVIELLKKAFPKTPVVLGGIYATLCHEHAEAYSGADLVFEGGQIDHILTLVAEIVGTGPQETDRAAYPVFDLYPRPESICLVTSKGCPYRCSYCASFLLESRFSQRNARDVVNEVSHWASRFSVGDIAFHDDALLVDVDHHFIPILKGILERDIRCRFHLPNGIHARGLTGELADLMFRVGFKTVRLGLETINPTRQIETGGKVEVEDVKKAVMYLRETGFSSGEIGVYLMAGLPGQSCGEVEAGIERVWEWGATPKIAEYSPIPHTPLWEEAVRHSSYDIREEPLFHNNSILPCQWGEFSCEDLRSLKSSLQRRLRGEVPPRSEIRGG